MLLLSHVLLFFLRTAFFVAAQGVESGGSTTAHRGYTFTGGSAGYGSTDPCMTVSPPCVTEADRYSLEALWSIHQMMDDDQDGGIEVEESVEFIIEDMKQQQTNKHSNLHQEDQHITIEELWRGWKSSTVHNWTQDEVLRWLREFVELPQYERNFKDFKVNGNTLPRIAANEPSFLSGHLRVQDQRDKQKLNIKALDVVLFGPPTRPHNYVKDMLLIVSVVMGIGGCWFAQAQNKASKIHVAKMMKDLESLQRAEQSLRDLQEQLERAQEEKRNVAEEKQNLEEKMRDEIMGAQEEAHRLHRLRQGAVTELSRLRYAEEELEQIRGALKQAEMDIQASWSASEALQLWLQLTHEVEVQYYNVKKQMAELQLNTAKEEAEKIKKKRSSVLGTLHMAHSSSLDQVDHKILEAKNSLFEVTACLRERLHRWQQIEFLCGFPIFRNPGLGKLTAQLYSDLSAPVPHRGPQAPCSCQSSVHGSMEDLFEDPVTPVVSAIPISSIKHSPLTRGSTTCRSRRPEVITQSLSSTISSDPDLIMPARASQPCFEEQEGNFLNHKKRHESLEVFPDGEYMTSTPFGRMIAKSATIDCSAQKVNQGEVEVLADSSVVKSSNEELEASIESSNTIEEIEVCANVTTRKMKNNIVMDSHRGLGTPPDLVDKVDTAESLMDAISLDGQARKGLSDEYEDFAAMKMDGDTTEVLVDTAAGNISSDVSDFPLDATTRKKFWNEDIPVNVRTRKISRDTMGGSMDSGSEKIIQGEIELHFDTITRKFTRDMMGMSMDTCFTKLSWDKGEFQLDSSVRGMPIEKMSVFAGTKARKVSREESKYTGDTSSRKNVQRESLLDIPSHKVSREKQEFGLESSASRKILRDDQETPITSIRRRLPRDIESSIDTSTGNDSWDRADIHMESAKQRMQSDSSSCRIGQPDLTVTSLLPQKPASECFHPGQLSLLVYDGILEKSCKPFEPTPNHSGDSSASVPNLPHNILQRDTEPHLPPASTPLSTQTRDGGEGRSKDKEKSKKSSILKNLFKKKKEPASEKPQSGLQKL